MVYVDGFVIPVHKDKIATYRKIARKAGKIWMEHGALQYVECVGDDLKVMEGTLPFTKLAGTKANETVIFSWILYRSKAQRDKINAKVMKDPRMTEDMGKQMPFDVKRMAYGGFTSIVEMQMPK